MGREGDDQLFGGDGADALDGGEGNDILNGGNGDDVYMIDSPDDFAVDIAGTGGHDTVYFTSSYFDMDLQTAFIEDAINMGGANATVLGTSDGNYLEGGTGDEALLGREGNDTLWGASGNDYLSGDEGNDVLWGVAGNDTYAFSAGFGQDEIHESSISTTPNADVVSMLYISPDQLWFSHAAGSNDLTVSVLGTTDSVRITDWYVNDTHKVERFECTDDVGTLTLQSTQIESLLSVMSTFTTPPASLVALTPALQAQITGAWHPAT
jgi:Ca2+-binding RTX toxin-like protein